MPNSTALLEFTVYCVGYITHDPASELANNKINIWGLMVCTCPRVYQAATLSADFAEAVALVALTRTSPFLAILVFSASLLATA